MKNEKNNHNKYLITGGAGFIGSHLVENLLSAGSKVIVYDNFSTGFETNLIQAQESLNKGLTVIKADIRDVEKLNLAMRGVDGVFHLAALVSVPISIDNPSLSFDINSRGTQIVLEQARKNNVFRVVLASSAAVYGENLSLPLKESESNKPISPYGLDKYFSEQIGSLYSDLYKMNVTCLRFFNVFGPRQPPDSCYSGVVSIFAKKITSKEKATIYGDGSQTRDFVYVKDVVNALTLSMNSLKSGFYTYNVGSGREISVNELWELFCQISELKQEPDYKLAREGDIKRSLASIDKIKLDLGYNPAVYEIFKKNIRETLNWLASIESLKKI